jgi:hypothetical protein
MIETKIVKLEFPKDCNIILGHSHFIKTVEDLHETLVDSASGIRFGLAFCESSGPCLVRSSGTDEELKRIAERNALNLGAGHSFVIVLGKGFYPINVLNSIKNVQEVCRIFCATANPVEVIIAETSQGRGILGVIDGSHTKGIETEKDIKERKELLRKLGYKL